jgi:hypothetical protein
MNRIAGAWLLAVTSFAALAHAPVPATNDPAEPVWHAGDSWSYRITTEKGRTVISQVSNDIVLARVTATTLYYTQRVSGGSGPALDQLAGADWSRVQTVDGKEVVVNRPLAFPLTPGKHWTVEYNRQHPTPTHALEQWSSRYTVVGTEDVTVPAGVFHAIKIEAEGNWLTELEPSALREASAASAAPRRIGGRTYKAFWYAPEVKRWVRAVEEYYDSTGARASRFSSELTAWSLQP